MLLLVQLKHAQEMTTPAHSYDGATVEVHSASNRGASPRSIWGGHTLVTCPAFSAANATRHKILSLAFQASFFSSVYRFPR